jgi:hypothetical protein
MPKEDFDQSRIKQQTRFKEIIAGIKSCFSLTANERLIIMLILALFLLGFALRWRHLNQERADPDLNESRDEPPKSAVNSPPK